MPNAWRRLRFSVAGSVITIVASASLCAAPPAPSPSQPQQQPPAPGGAPSVPAQEQTILGPPPVRFQPESLDLGTLKPGGEASGVIMIQNISDKVLTIKATRPSCTCTAINLANTTIAPGQAIPLDVGYRANATMGPKKEAVRILFDGYDMVEVPILAFVGLAVRSEPLHIDALRKADGQQTLFGEIKVFSIDQKPFRVLAVNGKPPEFLNANAAIGEPASFHTIKWDLTGYDPRNNCRNAAGERMPGSIIIETDHPEAPIFDLEIRHDCTRRKPATAMDAWAASDKRVILGMVKPAESVQTQVLLKWLPQRDHSEPPTAVISESPQFSAEIASIETKEDGLLVTLKITPAKDAKGLIYGPLRLHSNRQSSHPVHVIATVR